MRKITLESVKDCEVIFTKDDTVILSGKYPWIFRRDGTYVARLKSIRNAYRMVFLPGNRVLMDGAGDEHYHCVSLENGEILWSIPQIGKRDSHRHFVVTKDGKFAYLFFKKFWKHYVECIDLSNLTCETYRYHDLGALHYSYCDDDGYLCNLHSFVKNERLSDEVVRKTAFTGIAKWRPNHQELEWIYSKTLEYTNLEDIKYVPRVACNEEYILFDDFIAESLKDGKRINLIENSPDLPIDYRSHFLNPVYDPERKLLTVRFLGYGHTIVIDCEAHRVVAHYAPIDRWLPGGCVIGDEFWIGTYEGVIRRPFPHMDEYPKCIY